MNSRLSIEADHRAPPERRQRASITVESMTTTQNVACPITIVQHESGNVYQTTAENANGNRIVMPGSASGNTSMKEIAFAEEIAGDRSAEAS